jgi:hypothetical protein
MRLESTTFPIGSTKTLLARVTSRDGAGAATGVSGEGNFITAAQVSTIACKVYDRSSSTPNTSAGSPSITSAAVIAATTSTVLWTVDAVGYNFLFDLTTALIATAGHVYRVVVDITLTTGTVIEAFGWEGKAEDVSP